MAADPSVQLSRTRELDRRLRDRWRDAECGRHSDEKLFRPRIRLRPSQRLTFGAPLEVSTRLSAFAYRDSLSCVAMSGLRGQGLPGIDAGVTLAVMSMFPGVLCDGRRGTLDGCVPGPEVSNEGSEFGGTFERGEGA